jgi:hypothetical protein
MFMLALANGIKVKSAGPLVESNYCTVSEGRVKCRGKVLSSVNDRVVVWEDVNSGLSFEAIGVDGRSLRDGDVYIIEMVAPSVGSSYYEVERLTIIPETTVICTDNVSENWNEIAKGYSGVDLDYIYLPNDVRLPKREGYKDGDPTFITITAGKAEYVSEEEAVLYYDAGEKIQCPGVRYPSDD